MKIQLLKALGSKRLTTLLAKSFYFLPAESRRITSADFRWQRALYCH